MSPGSHPPLSTRRLLMQRVQIVLVTAVAAGLVFGTAELLHWQPGMLPSLLMKLLVLPVVGVVIVLLGRPWVLRHIRRYAVLILSIAYVWVGLDRMLIPGGAYGTTAILFVGAALTTGALLPLGLVGQLVTVLTGAATLGVAILLHDGSLAQATSDPGIAVAIGFLFSLVAARETERHRRALNHHLLERRRAEGALRRLALRLEQRVAERTAALEEAHVALRHHQAELAHALRLHTMGAMAAALAHEINQPLCAITNYARGGVQRLRNGTTDAAALEQAFEEIALQGLRAGEVVHGIRKLVQRETTVSDGVDLNALATEAVRLLEPQARLHGVAVHLALAPNLPPVRADGTQIEQVVLNLMLNGVEAAAGGPDPEPEVVVTTRARADGVEVAVRDTGTGLSPAVEATLFTPFVTTKPKGLGLGLAISRSIVELHDGRLWATSQPGAGATFHFFLPRRTAVTRPAARAKVRRRTLIQYE
jgi:signal transduction histidine kinase